MFLFSWQRIAQNCQNNNIKIWWISEGWDSLCESKHSHGDSSYPVLERKTAVRGVLCSFISLQRRFRFSWCGLSFLQFCCSTAVTWVTRAAAPVQCSAVAVLASRGHAGSAGWVGCLQHCLQRVQPLGCVLCWRALATGRVSSMWKAVWYCCCSWTWWNLACVGNSMIILNCGIKMTLSWNVCHQI